MSGIYIPGMELPKSCHVCPLVDTLVDCPCKAMNDNDFWDSGLLEFAVVDGCPLVPVPDGRLIDADAIEYVQSENGCLDDYAYRYDINEMPTVDAVEARPSAMWIDLDDHVMCSSCGACHYGVDKKYCPHCGAKMEV